MILQKYIFLKRLVLIIHRKQSLCSKPTLCQRKYRSMFFELLVLVAGLEQKFVRYILEKSCMAGIMTCKVKALISQDHFSSLGNYLVSRQKTKELKNKILYVCIYIYIHIYIFIYVVYIYIYIYIYITLLIFI